MPAHSPFRRFATPALLCAFAAMLVGVTWWTTLAQLRDQEDATLAAAARDATNIATVFQEHSTRTIQSADQAVQFVKYQYAVQGRALDLGALVDAGVILGDIFNLYSVVDETGQLILSSQHFNPGNYSDREHVRVHQLADTGALFLSKPVLGRVSGKWSMQMTRRINRADGGFGGVVVVSMDPFYFTRVYQSLKMGANDTISLVGDDGIVRARRAGGVIGVGQDVSASPVARAARASPTGTVRMHSAIDGRDRIYAYRHLGLYPLFVNVGLDVEDLLAPLAGLRRAALWKAAGFTAVIALFTVLMLNLFARLLRSHARALAANAAKTQFLAHMSQELRTPLHGMLAKAGLLADGAADAEQRGHARAIETSGAQLLALVNTLLQLGRIDGGGSELEIAHIELAALLAQVRARHAASAAAKGLGLTLTLGPGLPPAIWSDRAKLAQILDNLVGNAIKFSSRGQVRLSATLAQEQLLLTVADDGPGIALHWQQAVFDRFVQVDAGDGRAEGGAGLGLAIARGLATLLGGEITLESSAGTGATFRVALPLLPARALPVTDIEQEAA